MEDIARGMTPAVAIIGGGWAGCAAALRLTDAGVPVVLYEAAAVLGGRARRVERDGLCLDNGQHLLLGAYRQTLALLVRFHATSPMPPAWIRRPLGVVPFSDAQSNALALVARTAPGRLGLLAGLLTASGFSLRERLANIRWFMRLEQGGFVRPAHETVAQMLAPLPPRVASLLWEPLCLAALNTAVSAASAQIFANVLRAAFTSGGASDFVLPATDLTELMPSAVARHLEAQGANVVPATHAQVVRADRDVVTLAAGPKAQSVQSVIVAVGPHQLGGAFAPEVLEQNPALAAALDPLNALRYEPIVTIWLGYGAKLALPSPIARLDDAPGQWVVDRPDVLQRATPIAGRPNLAQLLAVIISASGAHMKISHDALIAAVDAQLRRLQPVLATCLWSWVISEKRATYACTPDRVRPTGARIAPGIYLAGDYVDVEYPATLEAAVRSGNAAADAVLADRDRPE